jgi:hypothetical protein
MDTMKSAVIIALNFFEIIDGFEEEAETDQASEQKDKCQHFMEFLRNLGSMDQYPDLHDKDIDQRYGYSPSHPDNEDVDGPNVFFFTGHLATNFRLKIGLPP